MTPKQYIEQLDYNKQKAYLHIYNNISHLLNKQGYTVVVDEYKIPTFAVPLSMYPKGYLGNPEKPLPYISLAANKQYLSLYHYGLYAMPDEAEAFKERYESLTGKRLNMGKSCIRINYGDTFPMELLTYLATLITPEEFKLMYTSTANPS